MRITTMHTKDGPVIGIGDALMNTTAAQKVASDIVRAVIDAHRTESVVYRHEVTPNFHEYPTPTFEESASFEHAGIDSAGGSHE